MESTEYKIDFQEIFEILKKRWMFISIITVSFMVIVALISLFILTPIYETATTMIVKHKQNQDTVMTYNDLQTSQKLVATYSEILKSEHIADTVINTLMLDMEPEDLHDKIKVSQVLETEILKIKVTDPDPEMAALIANTVSNVFQTEISRMLDVENISTIDVAKVPDKPVKPTKTLNVVIAGSLGLMFSVCIVFAQEFLNRTYKTSNDVDRHLGLPLIGEIPDMMLEKIK